MRNPHSIPFQITIYTRLYSLPDSEMHIEQVNEKIFRSRRGNIGMIEKGGSQRQGWQMNVGMVISIESTGTNPIYCHRDYLVCCNNIGHVPVDS